jgi:hypothetical protein
MGRSGLVRRPRRQADVHPTKQQLPGPILVRSSPRQSPFSSSMGSRITHPCYALGTEYETTGQKRQTSESRKHAPASCSAIFPHTVCHLFCAFLALQRQAAPILAECLLRPSGLAS